MPPAEVKWRPTGDVEQECVTGGDQVRQAQPAARQDPKPQTPHLHTQPAALWPSASRKCSGSWTCSHQGHPPKDRPRPGLSHPPSQFIWKSAGVWGGTQACPSNYTAFFLRETEQHLLSFNGFILFLCFPTKQQVEVGRKPS